MNKLGISHRLSSAGLRHAADAYREEVRQRLARCKPKGTTKEQLLEDAWNEMWEVFKPPLERWEKEREKEKVPEAPKTPEPQVPPEPQLVGCTDDLDQFLDPLYSETDPGKQLRDGLLWTAFEIRRIVTDSENTTTIDLARAKTPPPTAWAVFCLESFARKPPDKRAELIGRVLPFATRAHNPSPPKTEQLEEDGGFLDDIS
jgi:hypothetical protein